MTHWREAAISVIRSSFLGGFGEILATGEAAATSTDTLRVKINVDPAYRQHERSDAIKPGPGIPSVASRAQNVRS